MVISIDNLKIQGKLDAYVCYWIVLCDCAPKYSFSADFVRDHFAKDLTAGKNTKLAFSMSVVLKPWVMTPIWGNEDNAGKQRSVNQDHVRYAETGLTPPSID